MIAKRNYLDRRIFIFRTRTIVSSTRSAFKSRANQGARFAPKLLLSNRDETTEQTDVHFDLQDKKHFDATDLQFLNAEIYAVIVNVLFFSLAAAIIG